MRPSGDTGRSERSPAAGARTSGCAARGGDPAQLACLEVQEPLAGEPGQLGDAALRALVRQPAQPGAVPVHHPELSPGQRVVVPQEGEQLPIGRPGRGARRGPEEGRAAGDDALQGERERGLGRGTGAATSARRSSRARPCAGHPPMLRSRPGLGKSEIGAEHRTGRSDRDRDRLHGGCGDLRGAVHDPAPRAGDRVRSPPGLSPRRRARGDRRAGVRDPRLGDAAGRRELRLREPRAEPVSRLHRQLLAVVLALHRHRGGELSLDAVRARRGARRGCARRGPGAGPAGRARGASAGGALGLRRGEPARARDLPARAAAAPRADLPSRGGGHRLGPRPRARGAPRRRSRVPPPRRRGRGRSPPPRRCSSRASSGSTPSPRPAERRATRPGRCRWRSSWRSGS